MLPVGDTFSTLITSQSFAALPYLLIDCMASASHGMSAEVIIRSRSWIDYYAAAMGDAYLEAKLTCSSFPYATFLQ